MAELLGLAVGALITEGVSLGVDALKDWYKDRQYWKSQVFEELKDVEVLIERLDRLCGSTLLLAITTPKEAGSKEVQDLFGHTVEACSDFVDKVRAVINSRIRVGLEQRCNAGRADRKEFDEQVKEFIAKADDNISSVENFLHDCQRVLNSSILATISSNSGNIVTALKEVTTVNASALEAIDALTSKLEGCKLSETTVSSALHSAYMSIESEIENVKTLEEHQVFRDVLAAGDANALPTALRVNVAESASAHDVNPYFLHKVFVNVPISRYGGMSYRSVGCMDVVLRFLSSSDSFRLLLVGGPGYGKSSVLQIVSAFCRSMSLTASHPSLRLFDKSTTPLPVSELPTLLTKRLQECRSSARSSSVAAERIVPAPPPFPTVRARVVFSVTFKKLDLFIQSNGTNVFQFLCECALADAAPHARVNLKSFQDFMAKYLRVVPSLAIFDGLDEILDDRRREACLDAVTKFLNDPVSGSQIQMASIIATRPLTTGINALTEAHGFSAIELGDLTQELVEQYARALLMHAYRCLPETSDFNEKMSSVRQATQEGYLGKCCLQVAMVADLVRMGYTLPDTKPKLFEFYVDKVIAREINFKNKEFLEEKSEGFNVSVEDVTKFHRWCGILLFIAAVSGSNSKEISKDTCRLMAQSLLEKSGMSAYMAKLKADQLMRACEERFCFLVSRNPSTLEFSTDSFLEYFVAEFLLEDCACFSRHEFMEDITRKILNEICRSSTGQEVFLFLFGGALLGRKGVSASAIMTYLEDLNKGHHFVLPGSYAARRLLSEVSFVKRVTLYCRLEELSRIPVDRFVGLHLATGNEKISGRLLAVDLGRRAFEISKDVRSETAAKRMCATAVKPETVPLTGKKQLSVDYLTVDRVISTPVMTKPLYQFRDHCALYLGLVPSGSRVLTSPSDPFVMSRRALPEHLGSFYKNMVIFHDDFCRRLGADPHSVESLCSSLDQGEIGKELLSNPPTAAVSFASQSFFLAFACQLVQQEFNRPIDTSLAFELLRTYLGEACAEWLPMSVVGDLRDGRDDGNVRSFITFEEAMQWISSVQFEQRCTR
jgi:hypothetical protein